MNKFRVGDLRVRETGAEDEMDSLLSNKEPLESGSRDDSISDENEKAELCGVGAWTPKLMQKLNNSDCALLFLSLLVCFEGMVLYGEAPTTLSSIETRYDFKSWVAGFLLSMSDVGIALTLIPISYLGSNVNKCQWIAYGAVSFSIGCLLYSAPHFLSDSYQLSSNLTLVQNGHLCGISDNDSFNYTFNEDDDDLTRRSGHCDFVQDSKTGFFAKGVYFLLFAAGRFLQGAGCVPLYVLAIVYLDENVLPSRSSLYMGIFYCLSLVGPTGGYIIGALFLRVYVNVDKVFRDDSFEVSQDNPLWIGAWWAGYLLGAVLVMLCAVPVSLYPKRLPGYKEVQAQRVSEVHKDESELERTLLSSDEDHTTKLRQVWGATKDLIVGNRPFLLLSLSNSCDSFLIFGMAAFFPKYLESQFNLTASSAALMAAAVAVPSAGGGTFLGGWVVERFDMSATQIISFCKWVTFLSVPLLLVFLVPCGNQDYAGINYDYPFDETNLELDPNHNFESRFLSYCNSECNCMDEDYFPLCGIDSVQYYSPCHAGCVSDVDPGSKMAIETYTNCSCVGASKTAKPGLCGYKCSYGFALYLGLFSIIVSTSLSFVPTKVAILRIVPGHQRSLALGLRWVLSCIFGSIPGPVLIGLMFDGGCVLYKRECGLKENNCVVYDSIHLRIMCMLVALIMKVGCCVLLYMAEKSYRPPVDETSRILEEPNDQDASEDSSKNSQINFYDLIKN